MDSNWKNLSRSTWNLNFPNPHVRHGGFRDFPESLGVVTSCVERLRLILCVVFKKMPARRTGDREAKVHFAIKLHFSMQVGESKM